MPKIFSWNKVQKVVDEIKDHAVLGRLDITVCLASILHAVPVQQEVNAQMATHIQSLAEERSQQPLQRSNWMKLLYTEFPDGP